jgi:hypothetical protein
MVQRAPGSRPQAFRNSSHRGSKSRVGLEEEYPGIGFRDAASGREAYVLGHRVAVWEVLEVYREAKTIAKTADHFGWAD